MVTSLLFLPLAASEVLSLFEHWHLLRLRGYPAIRELVTRRYLKHLCIQSEIHLLGKIWVASWVSLCDLRGVAYCWPVEVLLDLPLSFCRSKSEPKLVYTVELSNTCSRGNLPSNAIAIPDELHWLTVQHLSMFLD